MICAYIYTHRYICIYIYIYIQRERYREKDIDRERERYARPGCARGGGARRSRSPGGDEIRKQ